MFTWMSRALTSASLCDSIPDHLRICTECDADMLDTNAKPFYKFCLEVEDDEGTRLQVPMASMKVGLRSLRLTDQPINQPPINQQHGCGFLSDLEPADLREDEEALQEFKQKLRPLLGDLIERNEDGVDTPYHNIVLAKSPTEASLLFWDFTPLPRQGR